MELLSHIPGFSKRTENEFAISLTKNYILVGSLNANILNGITIYAPIV